MLRVPHFNILTINTEWRETEFSRLCDVTVTGGTFFEFRESRICMEKLAFYFIFCLFQIVECWLIPTGKLKQFTRFCFVFLNSRVSHW